jgi:plasmid stabilization system protein ParE
METKLSKLRAAMETDDWATALRIAAKFPRLGEHREAITRAWAAITHRLTYEQMGHNVDSLISTGVAALKARYP